MRHRARPPSVDALLAQSKGRSDPGLDDAAVTAVAREVQADERARLETGAPRRSLEVLADEVVARLTAFAGTDGTGPVRVINATGVMVHTNLGRASWAKAAREAADRTTRAAVLLELDRGTGKRGQRYRDAEEHLIALTGAEDALITNNNAAALALAVGVARRRGVAVSRGELVEIGGGVRIPDIVRRAGARLVELGTTNRTRVTDYEEALSAGQAALVLRVHRSNFRLEGFVESPDVVALGELCQRYDVPLIDDLGSGALLDTAAYGLAHEPTPRERLDARADIVTFSGDKLVGGPQAGLIAGRADLIARMRRDPLARAMRPDKTTLAAVAATLALYRAGRAALDIPVWRMLATSTDQLRARATRIAARLPGRPIEIVSVDSTVGGGALPGQTLPSVGFRIEVPSPSRLAAELRRGEPCVVGRIEGGALWLDLRTVVPDEDDALMAALEVVLGSSRT